VSEPKNIADLIHEFEQMPEYKLFYGDLPGLEVSEYTFRRNFFDLSNVILFITTDIRASNLYNVVNKDKLQAFLYEIACRTHNFVAGAMSRVDHTRKTYRRLYRSKETFRHYQGRIDKDFANDPLSQFVEDLRNYCLHYSSSPITVRTTFPNENAPPVRKVYLLWKDLKSFKEWSPLAKEYITSKQEDVNLLEVAIAYYDKVSNFNEWFKALQSEVHAEDLKRLRMKHEEIRKHLPNF
jgi:hypothetical protein